MNEIGGYSIVQADSADAVAKLFGKEQPHRKGMPFVFVALLKSLAFLPNCGDSINEVVKVEKLRSSRERSQSTPAFSLGSEPC